MSCTAGPRAYGGIRNDPLGHYESEPQPGPSHREDPGVGSSSRPMSSSGAATTTAVTAAASGYASSAGSSRGANEPELTATAALSVTSLAMERHPSGNRSVQQIPNNLTRVQASKSSAKIILDDQQTGYLAVVPPDVERDLVSSDARDSDLVKRDSEKDDEQQNDDDDDDDDEE